ncbi:hypothetical protein CU098_010992, partial [Rhizopus stolonifer]
AYDNLFDTGPAMATLNQLVQYSVQQAPQSPTIYSYNNNRNSTISILSSASASTITTTTTASTTVAPASNPWPNRIASLSQLTGMQIHHTHTPVGLYGGPIGALLLEYWERIIKSLRREWITSKLIAEDELERTIETMRDEVNEYNTYMSWLQWSYYSI